MDRQPRESAQPPSPTAASDSRFAQHHRAPRAALKVARRPWQGEPARDRGYFGKRENRPVARFELLSQARFPWSPTLPQQSVPPQPPALSRLSHYSPATSVRTCGRASKLRNGLIRRAEQHFIAAGARQIIENVTGFFSILHEWSRTENPRAGNDSRERLAAVQHGAPRLSTSEAGPKRGRRPPSRPDTRGSAIR